MSMKRKAAEEIVHTAFMLSAAKYKSEEAVLKNMYRYLEEALDLATKPKVLSELVGIPVKVKKR